MVKLQIAKNLTVDSEKLFIAHSGIAGSTGSGKSRHVAAKILRECLEKQPIAPDGARYAELVWFCDAGILQRKISTGNVFWYSLVVGMAQRIRVIQE